MLMEVRALRRTGLLPVSFSLAAGECLAIAGPSGCGKSLLLRAIADLDPNEGEVRLAGAVRDAMPAPQWRRRVGYVPAEPGWWADTVGQHFDDWAAAQPLVTRLGLPADANAWPMTRPSSGERLRLALVRALMNRPAVLLLDEPTAALDAAAVGLVESLVADQLAQGLAVVWVSHDPAQVTRVARRCLRWDGSQFVAEAL
ncbi:MULTISPECIES: ATP-binding cassette domain-containing protein [unclassified Paludibacterium]|uniref:ABC transporter ATP-binding protein n=1 Tax=unclassified Paludibacterium TaxID=2618429 RepID=UPI001C049CC7|nr:ATP-binding cassette domain-containing protein [Paludibacterium sp. B53371]BEV70771.1 ATP-binding cassette domain-containing protein [Paludibacterium sp. THUN1379]